LITKTVADNEVTDRFNLSDEDEESDSEELKIEVENVEEGNTSEVEKKD